jgi:hypothetical protein
MARINWDASGAHVYEAGVDRGVLYVGTQPGVAWNGLTSIDERPSGGAATPYYIDGMKYLNVPAAEEFAATISAFTYPDEFGVCDGTVQVVRGLFALTQRRQPFGLSYRTKVGNELVGNNYGYKIHLIYGALAAPSQRTNSSLKDSSDPTNFSWDITTLPPAISGFRNTSHLVLDSRLAPSDTLSEVEDILYGTDTDAARIPSLAELVAAFTGFTVTDNEDGTFTVTGPSDSVEMLDSDTFQIISSTATFIDSDSYTLASA